MSRQGILLSIADDQEGANPSIVTPNNRLPVVDKNYDIAAGNIQGHTALTIFGRIIDLGIGVEETVWQFGGKYNYLTANTELFISSSDAADTNTVIVIDGLDDSYIEKQLTFTFTGGQEQQSIGDFFRILRAVVVSGSEPLGDMYIAESDTLTSGVPDTSSKVKGYIPQGNNRTNMAVYTVPAGHIVLFTRLYLSVRKNEDAVFTFISRTAGQPGFIRHSDFPVYESSLFQNYDPAFAIPEKTDVEMRVISESNNTGAVTNAGIIVIHNEGDDYQWQQL